MLRFIKHNLTGIDGVEIYPLISLLIFVLFFAFVITYVIRMKKQEIDTLGSLPLDDGEEDNTTRIEPSGSTGKINRGALVALLVLMTTGVFAQNGEGLFKNKCNTCHALGKNSVGPDLKGVRQKWVDAGEGDLLYEWVRNSGELIASGKSKMANDIKNFSATEMTPQDVTNEDVDAVLSYIDSYVAPAADAGGTTPPTDGEVTVVYKPNYEKNLTLFYFLVAGILIQLIVIMVFTNSTRTLVEYKDKKDKGNAGTLKNVLVLVGLMGLMAAGNQAMALNFVEYTENPDAPWLLVEDSDIYFLVGINMILLVLVFHFRGLLMDIAAIVRPGQREKVSRRRRRKMNKVLTDAVPIEEEHTILMHHEYDGIRELDNNLPPWWLWGFYFTIFFAVAYILHYHILKTGDLQTVEYEKSVAEAEAAKEAYLKKMAMNVDETNVTLLTEDAALSAGKSIFEANCTSCHNPKGEGNGIGPNLTDKNWIYGFDIKDVFTTIKYGRPGGMPEHNSKLNPVQLQQVASYVLSLPPAKGRDPQGDIIEK